MKSVSGTPLSLYSQWDYGWRTVLRFGELIFESSSGVQQCDPARHVLFAMALANAIGSARHRFSNQVFDLWYADDGYILGKFDEVINAFENIAHYGIKTV